METTFYQELTTISLSGEILSDATCEKLLTASEIELLPLLDAAYQVRKAYFQNEVQLHILNNAPRTATAQRIATIARKQIPQQQTSKPIP